MRNLLPLEKNKLVQLIERFLRKRDQRKAWLFRITYLLNTHLFSKDNVSEFRNLFGEEEQNINRDDLINIVNILGE